MVQLPNTTPNPKTVVVEFPHTLLAVFTVPGPVRLSHLAVLAESLLRKVNLPNALYALDFVYLRLQLFILTLSLRNR